MHLNVPKSVVIHEDNVGCLLMCQSPVHHGQAKHINIRHHFLREHVANKDIVLMGIRTDEMIADILTKPLAKISFWHQAKRTGLSEIQGT